jgi:N-carbamoyl-L-amino-acid hydrolase
LPKIDGARLLADLRTLAQIGAYKTGVHRPTYSPQDMESREWLMQRMRDAGLEPEMDGIGNVIGRSPSNGPKLLLGSHIETQNHAGWLDGAMGVMYGLEVARAFAADPACAGLGIEVAAWADEEGHYGNFLGSKSFCGKLTEADIDASTNKYGGATLREALAEAGLAGKSRLTIDPARYRGYLEAHIEQGADLERSGLQIGVVTAIVGARQHVIEFQGVQNHAGTTRMSARKDAGVALVKLATAIYEAFAELADTRTVWTTGRITLEPGAPSIVPGRAEMLMQFRDTDPARLDRMSAALERLVADANAGPCRVTCTRTSTSEPTAMDAGFQQALTQAAERHAPGKHQAMPSGAGHDAQILATRLPSAMLFVPSIGGISHHYDENTSDEDLVRGCEVFADAAKAILG